MIIKFKTEFSVTSVFLKTIRDLLELISRCEWGLRFHISNKLPSDVIAGGPQTILQVTRVWSVSDGLVSNQLPGNLLWFQLSPPLEENPTTKASFWCYPFSPSQETLCTSTSPLSQKLTLTWNSQEYVMPSQATLELGNLKRLCLQPSSIRQIYPPCNHITRGHWEILSSFSL